MKRLATRSGRIVPAGAVTYNKGRRTGWRLAGGQRVAITGKAGAYLDVSFGGVRPDWCWIDAAKCVASHVHSARVLARDVELLDAEPSTR